MNRNLVSIVGLLVGAVLFVAVNILSTTQLGGARIDLTEDRLFTISAGTRDILAGIEEPISLRLYLSDGLINEVPAFRVYASRVQELLEEYVNQSGGMIDLTVIDPEPFSTAEDRAVQAGLQGVPLDQTSGEQVYFGLVGTNLTDRREIITFFQQNREQWLEYDLTKLVYNLTEPQRPVLGIVGDAPLEYGPGGVMAAMRGQSEPYILYTQLQQLFDVQTLGGDIDTIPDEVTILLVARPTTASDRLRYAIDQFVLGGGTAIVFADPWAESAAAMPGPTGMPDPSADLTATLPDLFAAWGIEMPEDQVVADPRLALRVASGDGGRRRTVPYPVWLGVTQEFLAGDDIVTADLQSLNLASVGSLTVREGADIGFEPLITSSDRAELVAAERLRGQPDPEGLLRGLSGDGQRRVLAARISGRFTTAFPDGPPPDETDDAAAAEDEEPAEAPRTHLSESAEPGNLIVVADSDLLEDRYWVQVQDFFGQRVAVPIASNADFVTNGVDNLSGSSALIGLRSRAGSSRPFTVFDDLRRSVAEQFLAREQELQDRLRETERQLTELQSRAEDGGRVTLLSDQEQDAINQFRDEALRIRRELRDVQHTLNKDIERLEAQVKIANIGLMPLLVALVAVVLATVRGQRRRARRIGD